MHHHRRSSPGHRASPNHDASFLVELKHGDSTGRRLKDFVLALPVSARVDAAAEEALQVVVLQRYKNRQKDPNQPVGRWRLEELVGVATMHVTGHSDGIAMVSAWTFMVATRDTRALPWRNT